MITSLIADGFVISANEPTAYERFWPTFLDVHQRPGTRVLHAVATVIGLACALVLFPLTSNASWLLIGLGVSYPIAWFSHAVFERSRPKAFSNPYWSFLADVDMLVLMALGWLDAEVALLRETPERAASPARRAWHLACEIAVLFFVVAVLAMAATHHLKLRGPGYGWGS